jgi:hypothetical protein
MTTKEALQFVVDLLQYYTDDGPEDAGWQSEELRNSLVLLEQLISALS